MSSGSEKESTTSANRPCVACGQGDCSVRMCRGFLTYRKASQRITAYHSVTAVENKVSTRSSFLGILQNVSKCVNDGRGFLFIFVHSHTYQINVIAIAHKGLQVFPHIQRHLESINGSNISVAWINSGILFVQATLDPDDVLKSS